MGENDDWIFAGNHRVEHSNAHILVTLLIMDHQACNFVYCERSSFKFISIG